MLLVADPSIPATPASRRGGPPAGCEVAPEASKVGSAEGVGCRFATPIAELSGPPSGIGSSVL